MISIIANPPDYTQMANAYLIRLRFPGDIISRFEYAKFGSLGSTDRLFILGHSEGLLFQRGQGYPDASPTLLAMSLFMKGLRQPIKTLVLCGCDLGTVKKGHKHPTTDETIRSTYADIVKEWFAGQGLDFKVAAVKGLSIFTATGRLRAVKQQYREEIESEKKDENDSKVEQFDRDIALADPWDHEALVQWAEKAHELDQIIIKRESAEFAERLESKENSKYKASGI